MTLHRRVTAPGGIPSSCVDGVVSGEAALAVAPSRLALRRWKDVQNLGRRAPMIGHVPSAEESTLLRQALRSMLEGKEQLIAVIHGQRKLVGVVDRADILRGLAGPGEHWHALQVPCGSSRPVLESRTLLYGRASCTMDPALASRPTVETGPA